MCGPNSCLKVYQTQDVHVECSEVVNFTPIDILVYLLLCVCFFKTKLCFNNKLNSPYQAEVNQTIWFRGYLLQGT